MKNQNSRNLVILLLVVVLIFMPVLDSIPHYAGSSLIHNNMTNSAGQFSKNTIEKMENVSSDQHNTDSKTSSSPLNKVRPTTFIPVKNFRKNGTDMSVNPQGLYDSEPAPMGIADYGLSTNGTSGYNSYSYSTPSFLGKVNITSLFTNNAQQLPKWGIK